MLHDQETLERYKRKLTGWIRRVRGSEQNTEDDDQQNT